MLTAARTSEVIKAAWAEVDFTAQVWAIPAERMKRRREHRVPLSASALQLLREAKARWPGSRWLFPGQSRREPLSNMALLMLMRRLGRKEVPHGLRSSFRVWCADHGHDRDLAEAALAHQLANKVEAAYLRTDFFERRRSLMEDWGAFVTSEPVEGTPAELHGAAAPKLIANPSDGEASWLALVGE